MSRHHPADLQELEGAYSSARNYSASRLVHNLVSNLREHRRALVSIGLIASSNIVASALAIVGSLVQARFILPDELGSIRKYSIISNYALFLSLGLFNIVQREYCVLMGKGETDRALRVVSIVQTWCLGVSVVVSAVLGVICVIEIWRGNLRIASALFIETITVWSVLYGGALSSTFRSGQEFKRLAKSSFFSSVAGTLVLPFFMIWPFAAFVVRSFAGNIVSTLYLHCFRPVRSGYVFPLKEFLGLVKQSLRLFAGDYLRYTFWFTVEIWIMLAYAGDKGVGLFVFSSLVVTSVGHVASAVNQVYMPRLAEHYGRTGSLVQFLKMSVKPTIVNLITALVFTGLAWLVLPPLLRLALPSYVPAIPLINILLLTVVIMASSLPLYMMILTDAYYVQMAAAIVGLAVFLSVAFVLHSLGLREMAVVWGTLTGRLAFFAVALGTMVRRLEPVPAA